MNTFTTKRNAPVQALILGLSLALGLNTGAEAAYANGLADLRMAVVPQANANNGRATTNLGDINGDGYLDLGVGLPGESQGGTAPGIGAISIYRGDPLADRPGAQSFSQLVGQQAGEAFGTSVSGAGDLNGDGFGDFIVGAPLWNESAALQDTGRAFVYFGVPGEFTLPVQSGELRGASQAGAQFGWAVAGIGDVNADGYADIAVGAPYFDDASRVDAGMVRIYFGGAGTTFDATPDAQMSPTAAAALFGFGVAGAGDVNGDGYADVLVGIPNATVPSVGGQVGEGAGLLYLGGPGAFDTNADLALESNQAGAALGTAVVGAGDVNGDGFSDIALGAPLYDDGETNEGAAFVYYGGSSLNNAVDVVVQQNNAGALLGGALAFGDSNGDGYADLAMGSPAATDYAIAEFGTVHMITGSSAGLGAETFQIRGRSTTTTPGRFGTALAFVDYNADGFVELFVGAPQEDASGRPAQGFPYLVRTALRLSATVDQTIDGNQGGAQLGQAIATGDLNGDGLSDVAVGIPDFDTGSLNVGRVELYYGSLTGLPDNATVILNGNVVGARFGRALAIADFNGDGYGDLAVGAPESTSNGGEVHVFYGSAGAFNTTVDRTLSIAQVGAQYGSVVANVGDLNGDGMVDLGIGAPLADIGVSNTGVAYLYFGRSNGIQALPDFEIQGAAVELRIGRSMAAAGDVNGDGIADLAVGSRDGATETGSVRLYFGGRNFNVVADQVLNYGATNARCSEGLAGAGDLNGDGYSDLIVGCPGETGSVTGGGMVRVHHGSVSGLITSPANTLPGTTTGSNYGQTVAGGGDLDADGYADVLIAETNRSSGGNTNNGGIHWIRGSATGLVAGGVTTISVPDNSARLGVSAVLADVNGDGFAEVIAGAPGIAGTSADFGALHVVHANGLGRSAGVQQFRNPSTPLEVNGVSGGFFSLFVVANGQSPSGRMRAQLQVELCPSALGFGSSNCVTSNSGTWVDLGNQPTGALLVANPSTLTSDTSYAWRARVLYAPLTVTQAGITAPAEPAEVGPWRRMRARADLGDARTQTVNLFRDGFE